MSAPAFTPVLPLAERLKHQAVRAADIARQMAEAKSLRQQSNAEQRTDLYMWPTPEQTTEGRAAELIDELYEALTELVTADAGDMTTVHPDLAKRNALRVLTKARGQQS